MASPSPEMPGPSSCGVRRHRSAPHRIRRCRAIPEAQTRPATASEGAASLPSVVPGTLIVLCGLPASGKTTLAKQLERERSALVLSEDVWVARMFPLEAAHDDDLRERIKAVQWDLAVRVALRGVDVVLDWGLWARVERDDVRAGAAAAGVPLEIRYLDVPREELLRRIAARNAALPPDTFHIEDGQLDEWIALFQPPTPDELT
jgi:predicted kinase